MARKTDVLIIGGGQAGLATSHYLTSLGLDHIVLERGQIAQRWRKERWNSLHLLTPNWMTRLPGHTYAGRDPHGFMHKDQVARMLQTYSTEIAAPVMTQTSVISVRRMGAEFHVKTNLGTYRARAVVLATGACDTPNVPVCAQTVDPRIRQITLNHYKSPAQIDDGGVLVVGASASGIQIASELQVAGRPVTLAVGQHTRSPRRYRGRDIMFWLDQCGLLAQPRDPAIDPDKLAAQHSFQLIGAKSGQTIDLGTFQAQGGQITGRLTDADGNRVMIENTLPNDIARAEARQSRMLNEIDTYIARHSIDAPTPNPINPIKVPDCPTQLNLNSAGINTIVWATGYRRDYSWLDIPVLSPRGEVLQQGGITPVPGLYTMGLPVMCRRNSTFIDGVGQDAYEITQHIAHHLGHAVSQAA